LQKVSIILIFGFLLAGCSVTRRVGDSYSGSVNKMSRSDVLAGTENLNITNSNFFVQKAEITVLTDEGSEKFIGSIKFEKPDKYLLSLRSRAGIEGARIYLSEDTVMINDRINRTFYYGSPQSLKKNYGISASLLHVVLGDFMNKYINDSDKANCSEGILSVTRLIDGVKITSTIDCKLLKTISVIPANSMNANYLEILFGDFFKENETVIPGKILVRDLKKGAQIEIIIEKVESPWIGNIEFVPGLNYEKLKLP